MQQNNLALKGATMEDFSENDEDEISKDDCYGPYHMAHILHGWGFYRENWIINNF